MGFLHNLPILLVFPKFSTMIVSPRRKPPQAPKSCYRPCHEHARCTSIALAFAIFAFMLIAAFVGSKRPQAVENAMLDRAQNDRPARVISDTDEPELVMDRPSK